MTVPRRELERLTAAGGLAMDLARMGETPAAYELLLAGLALARADRTAGESWGEELVSQWERLVDRFTAGHPVGRA